MSLGSAATLTVAIDARSPRNARRSATSWWASGRRQVVNATRLGHGGAGGAASYLSVRDWPLSAGGFFDQRDDAGANPVASSERTVIDQLFRARRGSARASNPRENVPFEVIGSRPQGQTAWGQGSGRRDPDAGSDAERRVIGTQILGTVDMIRRLATTADRPQARAANPHASPSATASRRARTTTSPSRSHLNEIAEASKNASEVMMNCSSASPRCRSSSVASSCR